MAYLTKKQVSEIIRKAPPGTSPAGIVAALRAKGHQLEGYNEIAASSEAGQSTDPYETGSPLTSPTFKYNPDQGVISGAAKAAGNLPSSAARNVEQIVQASANILNPDPDKNTIANLADVGAGALIEGAFKVFDLLGIKHSNSNSEEQQKFGGFVRALKDRYGSWDNIKRTLTEDPVGVALELYGATKTTGATLQKAENPALVSAGKKLDAVAETVNPLNVPRKAISSVKSGTGKVLEKITESPLDEGTKTVLNPTNKIPEEKIPEAATRIEPTKLEQNATRVRQKLDRYTKQAQKAVVDYSQPTPLELAGKEAEKALETLNQKLSKQGELKRAALKESGDVVVEGASKARANLRVLVRDRVGATIRQDGTIASAPGRISKVALDPADNQLLKEVDGLLGKLDKNATATKVDDVIDAIQDKVYKRKQNVAVPVNSTVEGTIKEVTAQLNKQLKRVVGKSYSTANSKYAYFVDTRDQLNKALGIDATKGGSLMKRVFSPTDGGTKALFKEIKKLTGIDLTEEATLAKFAMETVGDVRQRSLLENLLQSGGSVKSTLTKKAVDYLMKKTTDPVEAARKVIEKGKTLQR